MTFDAALIAEHQKICAAVEHGSYSDKSPILTTEHVRWHGLADFLGIALHGYPAALAKIEELERLLSSDQTKVEPCANGIMYELRHVERASFREPTIVVNHAGIVAAFMSVEEAAAFVEQAIAELEAKLSEHCKYETAKEQA